MYSVLWCSANMFVGMSAVSAKSDGPTHACYYTH